MPEIDSKYSDNDEFRKLNENRTKLILNCTYYLGEDIKDGSRNNLYGQYNKTVIRQQ